MATRLTLDQDSLGSNPREEIMRNCIRCKNMLSDVEYGLYYELCEECWQKEHPKQKGWDGSIIIKKDIFGNKWLAS